MSDNEETGSPVNWRSKSKRGMQNNCQDNRLWSNFNNTRSSSTKAGPKFQLKNRSQTYNSRINKGRKVNIQHLTGILLDMAKETYWGTITDVTYNLINFKPEDTLGVIDLFHGLTRLCSTKTPFKNEILQSVVHQQFLTSVQTFLLQNIKDCTKTEEGCEQIGKVFEDFIQLSRFAIEVLPSRLLFSLKHALTLTRSVLAKLEGKVIMKSGRSDIDKLFILMDEKFRREESTNQGVSADEVNELKLISILPTRRDLYEEAPELKKNIIDGAYAGVDHYITTQFKLLREDFIAPLREGIREYLSLSDKVQRKQSGVYFYHNVRILSASISSGKLGHVIQLDTKVNWRIVSQFFLFGSLLLFTTNNFNSFFLGTVIEVDNRNKTIIVKLHEMHNDVCNDVYAEEFTIAASKVFFEPYFHVLTALQKMIMEEFPMKKYIVQVNPVSQIPIYIAGLHETTYQMFGEQVNIMEASWPKKLTSFNPSQYRAFQAALTSEFVAIQGPPGTGKTFLGLQIVAALLDNVNINTPILVVCFKNHALDQFLEGILEKTKKIIRIGGRSQNKKLEEYNLKKHRASYGYGKFAAILEHLAENYFLKERYIKSLKTDGIVAIESLSPYISCTTTRWLMMNTNITDWLMEGMYVKMDESGILNNIDDDFYINLTDENCKENIRSDESLRKPLNVSSQQEFFRGKDNSGEKRSQMQTDPENEIIDKNGLMEENRRRLEMMYIDDYSNEYNNVIKKVNEHHDGRSLQQPKTSKEAISVFAQTIYDLQIQCEIYRRKIVLTSECISASGEEYLMDEAKQTMIMEAYKDNINDLKARIQYLKRMLPRSFRMTEEQKMKLYKICQFSVWSLTSQQRWMLYHSWVDSLIQDIKNEMRRLEESIRHVEKQLDEKRCEADLETLKKNKVVGLTTTGAAKLRPMLNKLGAKIVVIEEAAEVLESHIVASLSSQCQHVILIGDHKQLRPNPAVYRLCKKFNFDISLFERMVKNGLNCYQLDVQHRMRPEFASLIVPAVYSDLSNHSSTEDRPNILGVCHNLFFMTHNHPEEQIIDSVSRMNKFEARYVVKFANYLLQQGYKPEEISILATYAGQVRQIMKIQGTLPKNLRVSTVDDFQGEENKIIILSLVRSNEHKSIGFLKIENRVCVALSRARDGLFIIGNMELLAENSQIWPKVRDRLLEHKALGNSLSVYCQNHPETVSNAMEAATFDDKPEGGCQRMCEAELKCGHPCKFHCHPRDPGHEAEYMCQVKCERTICPRNHICLDICGKPCPPCKTIVDHQLQCGHVIKGKCSIDPDELMCTIEVPFILLGCGHKGTRYCGETEKEAQKRKKCKVICGKLLPCSHPCLLECHDGTECRTVCMVKMETVLDCGHSLNTECRYIFPEDMKAGLKCSKMREKQLTCGHVREIPCCLYDQTNMDCLIEVEKTLACGHTKKVKCFESTDLMNYNERTQIDPFGAIFLCEMKCSRDLPCGHKCQQLCCELCRCTELLQKKLSCHHTVQYQCGMKKDITCDQPCELLLTCGHKCSSTCGQKCSVNCNTLIQFTSELECGHNTVVAPCYLKNIAQNDPALYKSCLSGYCEAVCGVSLICGHLCLGICNNCLETGVHAECNQPCQRILPCSHPCTQMCKEKCPPCYSACIYRCSHSSCKGVCGEPCPPCQEPCPCQCVHNRCTRPCFSFCDRKPCNQPCPELLSCGHPCCGFCGELCPDLCTQCDPVAASVLDKNPHTRFVKLEDCGHIVEATHFDLLFAQNKLVSPLKCPMKSCQQPVVTTKRYKYHIQQIFRNSMNLKKELVKVESMQNVEQKRVKPSYMYGQQRNMDSIKFRQSKYGNSRYSSEK